MNRIYEDHRGILITTSSIRETRSIPIEITGKDLSLQNLFMVDSDESKIIKSLVFACFEIVESELGPSMSISYSDIKQELLIKSVTPWYLWIRNPYYMVKFFRLNSSEDETENLIWWLINLSGVNTDSSDQVGSNNEAKVIWMENMSIVDCTPIKSSIDSSIIEFERGFAMFYPGILGKHMEIYNNLLNKN